MPCIIGKNKITCYRGRDIPPRFKVQHKVTLEIFKTNIDKEKFDYVEPTYIVEVVKSLDTSVRKFQKQFLIWIGEKDE
jgi:hypothetical protein